MSDNFYLLQSNQNRGNNSNTKVLNLLGETLDETKILTEEDCINQQNSNQKINIVNNTDNNHIKNINNILNEEKEKPRNYNFENNNNYIIKNGINIENIDMNNETEYSYVPKKVNINNQPKVDKIQPSIDVLNIPIIDSQYININPDQLNKNEQEVISFNSNQIDKLEHINPTYKSQRKKQAIINQPPNNIKDAKSVQLQNTKRFQNIIFKHNQNSKPNASIIPEIIPEESQTISERVITNEKQNNIENIDETRRLFSKYYNNPTTSSIIIKKDNENNNIKIKNNYQNFFQENLSVESANIQEL